MSETRAPYIADKPYSIRTMTDAELTEIAPGFKEAVYIVAATDFEHFTIWGEYARESSLLPPGRRPVEWVDNCPSRQFEVGTVDVGGNVEPICIEVKQANIEGRVVLFYHPVGVIAHQDLIAQWWRHHLPLYYHDIYAETNPMNFHHVIDFVTKGRP